MHYYITWTSFARIDDPYLLKAFQLCRPDILLPSRNDLSGSLLDQCYFEVKKKVDSFWLILRIIASPVMTGQTSRTNL
jgi:hypothetical protein